jgi:hypothetical protein
MMVPQVWLVWRTISVADLSHTFLALYSLGELAGWRQRHRCQVPCKHVPSPCRSTLTPDLPLMCTSCAGLLLLTFYNTFLELWVFTVACALQLGERHSCRHLHACRHMMYD